jgi:hypothetical protein
MARPFSVEATFWENVREKNISKLLEVGGELKISERESWNHFDSDAVMFERVSDKGH